MNQGYAGNSSTVSLGNVVALQPPAPDSLPTHVEELAYNITRVEEDLQALSQTLSPIVRPLPNGNSAKDAGVPAPIRSSLSNAVVDQSERLKRLSMVVRELRESMDL